MTLGSILYSSDTVAYPPGDSGSPIFKVEMLSALCPHLSKGNYERVGGPRLYPL